MPFLKIAELVAERGMRRFQQACSRDEHLRKLPAVAIRRMEMPLETFESTKQQRKSRQLTEESVHTSHPRKNPRASTDHPAPAQAWEAGSSSLCFAFGRFRQ
ncbi:hypothetical protein LBMAG53_38500 [Planctomycetota bacterium]|nr:hypothetical protein LBMAG53_38500 [Planctomycetota bacterium]